MFPDYSYIFSVPFECPWKLQQKFCFVLQVGGKKDNIIKYWVFHLHTSVQFSSVSHVQLLATPWTAALQASLSITNSQSLLKLMSIESVKPSNHLILCCLLLLLSIFPSIRVFSNESVLCIRRKSTGVSASTSVFPMNIQDWFPLGWTGWISLLSNGFSRVFSSPTVWKHLSLRCFQPSLWSVSHIHTWILEKP